MTHTHRMWLLSLVLTVSGCDRAAQLDAAIGEDATIDAPGLDAACPPTPSIDVGVGTSRFIAWAEGDDLELVHGPQGGYHLEFTANFAVASSPQGTTVRYTVHRPDGSQLGVTEVLLQLRTVTRTSCGWFRGGDFVVMQASPAEVIDHDVVVTVALLDTDGTMLAEVTRRGRVVDRA